MPYTTLSHVQAHLQREVDQSKYARVLALISDAETVVDHETGSTWQSVTGTRRVECGGEKILQIPPANTISAVVLYELDGTSDTLAEADDWLARPGGAGHGVPPETIRALERYGCRWPAPPAYLSITGVWVADDAVPQDIALATALIVAAWCRAQGIGSASASDVKSESWGDYSVTFAGAPSGSSPREIPPEAERILARYRQQSDGDLFALGV